MLDNFLKEQALPQSFTAIAETWFIPVANELSTSISNKNTPYFIGINGCQGSGKSTLAEFLALYFKEHHGLRCAVLSLDDFYLSSKERRLLAEKVHPLLATRGVPGTHNINKIKDVLECLVNQTPTKLPRFNKATDNPYPESQWPTIDQADVVIFEGWCWGVVPQDAALLSKSCNSLEENFDNDATWRNFVNEKLADYLPLYNYMNTWLMLAAPSFNTVHDWRWQQEQKLANKCDTEQASKIMSESDIAHFIQHFERLTNHGLTTLPAQCDYVFQLDTSRQITSLRSEHAK